MVTAAQSTTYKRSVIRFDRSKAQSETFNSYHYFRIAEYFAEHLTFANTVTQKRFPGLH